MFSRPVDRAYGIKTQFGEKGRRYDWSRDPDSGFWLPIQDEDGFGEHRGVDFSCPVGTRVHAMSDGMVVRARYENPLDDKQGAGLYILMLVVMPGFDSWALKYSHLKLSAVFPGEKVHRGQFIALSGISGNVDQAFLHCDLADLRGQFKEIPFE